MDIVEAIKIAKEAVDKDSEKTVQIDREVLLILISNTEYALRSYP